VYSLKKLAMGTSSSTIGDTTGVGSTLNPYDRCIANKTIHGKHCTIIWHVNYLKISHAEKM